MQQPIIGYIHLPYSEKFVFKGRKISEERVKAAINSITPWVGGIKMNKGSKLPAFTRFDECKIAGCLMPTVMVFTNNRLRESSVPVAANRRGPKP